MRTTDAMIKRAARSVLVDMSNHPVQIVRGALEPHFEGEGGYFTTPSGNTVISHPNAYKWPMSYHLSTLHIVVGRGWARQQRLKLRRGMLIGRVQRVHGVTAQRLYRRGGVQWLCTMPRAGDPYHSDKFSVRDAVHQALQAWGRQREAAQLDAIREDELRVTFVSLDDSLKAGNCKSASTQFAQRVWNTISGGNPCAVRADVVLAHRDDSYTRRAVAVAAGH